MPSATNRHHAISLLHASLSLGLSLCASDTGASGTWARQGGGAAGVAILGMVWLGESRDIVRILCIGLIVAGKNVGGVTLDIDNILVCRTMGFR